MQMKTRGLSYLLVFISFIAATGLACQALFPTPTPIPTETPAPTEAPLPTDTPTPGVNTNLTTFTDQNNDYQIKIPADWTHKSSSGQDYYWDTFTSPDGGAVVENYTYLKGTSAGGTPWNDAEMKKYALQVLDKYYSKTGQPGDIEVTEVKPQTDGSVRLSWDSKSGDYSGLSYYEMRGTRFLLFTVDWGNSYKDQYIDTLNQVISSYQVPQ
jgi:hypothetical protein